MACLWMQCAWAAAWCAGAGIVIGLLALLTLKEPKEAGQPPKKPLLNKIFSLPFMSGVPPNPNAGKAAPPSLPCIVQVPQPTKALLQPMPHVLTGRAVKLDFSASPDRYTALLEYFMLSVKLNMHQHCDMHAGIASSQIRFTTGFACCRVSCHDPGVHNAFPPSCTAAECSSFNAWPVKPSWPQPQVSLQAANTFALTRSASLQQPLLGTTDQSLCACSVTAQPGSRRPRFQACTESAEDAGAQELDQWGAHPAVLPQLPSPHLCGCPE